MSELLIIAAKACLGWGHLFLRLGEWLIDLAQRNEVGW